MATGDEAADRKAGERFSRTFVRVILPIFFLLALFFVLDKFTGITDKVSNFFSGPDSGSRENITIAERYYMPVDDVLVSLTRRDGTNVFLNLSITFELERANDQAQIERVLPNIQDSLQVFLREVDPDDLQGSEGIYRLREELLFRINKVTHPIRLRDVLFRNIVLQ